MTYNMIKMNLFSSIFGSNANESNSSEIGWVPLTTMSQIDDLMTSSHEKPALIFKHSTGCGISKMALKQFERNFSLGSEITPYFLDLLAYRSVSNAVAERFGVSHQSPQLLLIKDGKAVYNVSHGDIDAGALKDKI